MSNIALPGKGRGVAELAALHDFVRPHAGHETPRDGALCARQARAIATA
jgi:hypothetical protein